MDAVLVCEGGGGAVSWSYRCLCLTPTGVEAEDGKLAIKSSRLRPETTRLRWQSEKLLEVGTVPEPSKTDTPFQYVPQAEDERGEEYEVKLWCRWSRSGRDYRCSSLASVGASAVAGRVLSMRKATTSRKSPLVS